MVDLAAQTIARAVRARRLELRLTTEEAAARARIPDAAWRVVEQGVRRPSNLMLGALCRALEWPTATIDDLVQRQLELNGNDEVVVDLEASERAEAAEPKEPEFLLDTTGLTSVQLREVQDYIDYLRERFS